VDVIREVIEFINVREDITQKTMLAPPEPVSQVEWRSRQ
jgi:hypothetical protein